MALQEADEFVARDSGLVENRQQGAARDVFALRNDDEAHAAGRVLLAERPMTAFAPVGRFFESDGPEGADNLAGGDGRKARHARAMSSGTV